MKQTKTWYDRTVKGDSVNAVAKRSGLVQPTLNRHVNGGDLPAESVIAIAKAYGVDPIAALRESGFLTADDVRRYRRGHTLRAFSDREIADEVWKRMVEGRLDEDGEPSLSVVEDITSGRAEPIAALKQSDRHKQFEQREQT